MKATGAALPTAKGIWLTSFWGFDPTTWGGVGFASASRRANFLTAAPAGSLLVFYVTKHKGPKNQRGKVVGFLEVTDQTDDMRNLTSPAVWATAQREAGTTKKWQFGVRASRAWSVIPEDWLPVEMLCPDTYRRHNAELIGANGVAVEPHEHPALLRLRVRETWTCNGFAPVT